MTARDNFDIEREAIAMWEKLSIDPPESISLILDFGRRCQDAAYEKILKRVRECCLTKSCPCGQLEKDILALKTPEVGK